MSHNLANRPFLGCKLDSVAMTTQQYTPKVKLSRAGVLKITEEEL